MAGPRSISCQTRSSSSAGSSARRRGLRSRRSEAPATIGSASGSRPRDRSAARAALTPAAGASPRPDRSRAPGVASSGAASQAQARNSAGDGVADDAPAAHRDRAVGEAQAPLESVLGDHDRRVKVLVEAPQQRDQLVAGDRVELRRRLVEQDQLRPARERRAERDALELATGQLGGRTVEQVRDPERERRLLDPARDRRRAPRPGSRAGAPTRRGRCPSRPASRDPGTASRRRRPALPDRGRACPSQRRSRGPRTPRRGNAARARWRRAAASTSRIRTRRRARPARPGRSRGRRARSPARTPPDTCTSRPGATRTLTARFPCGRRTGASAQITSAVATAAPPTPTGACSDGSDWNGSRSATRCRDGQRHDRGRRGGERDVVARPRPSDAPPAWRAARRAVAAHLERRRDVERPVEHAGRRRAHQPGSGRRRARPAALRLGEPARVAREHRDHPRRERRGQRGVKREATEQRQHLVRIDRGRVQRAAQDQRDRPQPEHGSIHGRLERDVGLTEHRQVAEPRDHGEPVARDERVDQPSRAGRAGARAAPRDASHVPRRRRSRRRATATRIAPARPARTAAARPARAPRSRRSRRRRGRRAAGSSAGGSSTRRLERDRQVGAALDREREMVAQPRRR